MLRPAVIALFVFGALAGGSRHARATDYFWIGGDGDVFDSNQWQDFADPNHHEVPGPDDAVWFYGSDPADTIIFSGDFATRYGYVTGTSGSVFLDLSGGAYTVDDFRVGEYDDSNPSGADNVTANIYGDPSLPHDNLISNFVTVGGGGTGTLWLYDAAQLRLMPDEVLNYGGVWLGYFATGVGTLNVADPGTVLDANNQYVYVGYDGTGTLWAFNGGQVVDIDTLSVGARDGNDNGNSVNVRDPGSLLEARTIRIGDAGEGTLWVTNQAQVALSQPDVGGVYIGYEQTGDGVVNVADAGSLLDTNGRELVVGYDGNGAMWVFNGGQVTSGTGTLGQNAGAAGFVSVNGTGSRWINTGELRVGDGGFGTLDVHTGGTVEAANVVVGVPGRITGDGTIAADVQNSGIVSPGAPTGVLHIEGDYLQSDSGELLIEIVSTSSFDRLEITGAATLDGTLRVTMAEEFVPSAGDSFGFLFAGGGFGGSFDVLDLPPLAAGLGWQLNPGGATVFLNVVAPLAGDFNRDGNVDAADYVLWRKTNSGDALAYDQWRENFGESAAGGGGVVDDSSPTGVPEPASVTLTIIPLLMMSIRRTASRRGV